MASLRHFSFLRFSLRAPDPVVRFVLSALDVDSARHREMADDSVRALHAVRDAQEQGLGPRYVALAP